MKVVYLDVRTRIGMERLWSRADATVRRSRQRASRRKPRNYLQTAASSCIRSMVRRGSTVRVRQRALQKRRTSALSPFLVQVDLLLVERAVDMEPFMEQ